MPKVKIPRKSTMIDMTAMCDVAFLLLTFFMLTTKFKPPELVSVDMPSSRSEYKIPEKNIMILTVDKDGRIFYSIDNAKVRSLTLDKMIAQYPGVTFTDNQKARFRNLEEFGVPIQQLPQLLDMEKDEQAKVGQGGIPVDSTASKFNRNELCDWIQNARLADVELRNKSEIVSDGISISVKGDGKTNYETMNKVIGTLTDKKINKFNLITMLEVSAITGN